MMFEDMPDEWKEWIELTPLERFQQSEKLFAQYLAMGGSLTDSFAWAGPPTNSYRGSS